MTATSMEALSCLPEDSLVQGCGLLQPGTLRFPWTNTHLSTQFL